MDEVSDENLGELEKRYRTTAFIFLFQIILTVILLVAAFFFVRERESAIDSNSLLTLWIAILFIAGGTFLLRRLFLNWERLKNVTLLKGVSGLIGALQFNALFVGSLALIIAIVGFVIAILTGETFDMIRAALVALIVLGLNFPRLPVWKKIVATLEKI